MYCSSCGTAVAPSLSYCNRCGAQLNTKGRQASPEVSLDVAPENLVWAIVAVSVGGLALVIGLMAVMKRALHLENELIVGFSLLSFLLIAAAEAVFIWKLISSQRRSVDARDARLPTEHWTRDVAGVAAPVLPDAAPTITEHTTRELDPALQKRSKLN